MHSSHIQLAFQAALQMKYRTGEVDRQDGPACCIVKNMFKKETDIAVFAGQPVVTSIGHCGRVEGSFGTAGKARVAFGEQVHLSAGMAVAMVQRKYMHT